MAKARRTFTIAQGAEHLGVEIEELRRGLDGSDLRVWTREHIDERELFLAKKWLDRNPRTGLTTLEAAKRLGCDYGDLNDARRHLLGADIELIPEDRLSKLRAWIRHRRGR